MQAEKYPPYYAIYIYQIYVSIYIYVYINLFSPYRRLGKWMDSAFLLIKRSTFFPEGLSPSGVNDVDMSLLLPHRSLLLLYTVDVLWRLILYIVNNGMQELVSSYPVVLRMMLDS